MATQKNETLPLDDDSSSIDDGVFHPNIRKALNHVPNFVEMIFVMPQNPGAITDRMIEYRLMKEAEDEAKKNKYLG
ncbi:MAG: hypothetical protein GY828_00335 [Candidatus Gracilibacteria bacterium]|nr:hypothetical protein [Candidatus Gracilibacteria bacterium]